MKKDKSEREEIKKKRDFPYADVEMKSSHDEKSESLNEDPSLVDVDVPSSVSTSEDKVKLKWWPILTVGFISLLLMLSAYFIGVKSLGADRYKDIINWLKDHIGAELAMFIYEYLCDSLILPLSPDLVWMVGADFDWWKTILIVGTASTLGGFTAYAVGILFDKIPFIRKFTGKIEKKWGAYINVYGVPFLIMAALLPLPFSTIVTVAGILHLGAKKSLPPCLLRYVHAVAYYWLFKTGLLLI